MNWIGTIVLWAGLLWAGLGIYSIGMSVGDGRGLDGIAASIVYFIGPGLVLMALGSIAQRQPPSS